nr:UBN2_2 domain-containing protein [Tanacetum cinerariifolium]
MDLDHALRIDPPAALTAESTVDHKRAYEQWERSNRMLLMIIKNSISVAIRGAIPDSENANEYLSSVEKQFKGTSKAYASTLILKMLTTKYDGVSGVREHIMMMSDIENKLKGMDMEISEVFLVHFNMTSLPMQFCPFKINYNTQKEKWKMSELIAMYVQKEERLKVEKPDIVHVAATNSNNRKGSWKGKGSSGDNSTPNKVQKMDASTSSFQGGPKCKFCHKKWHTQKDCLKFKEWGGEYYGTHTDVGQAPESFFDFYKDHGIINQYTMPGSPQQNGVAERRNRTLMDMVPSMLANSNLPKCLWTEASCILNRFPSRSVPKIPYEIWTPRKTNLRYLRVRGCPAKAKLYNPQSRKLDLTTISFFFSGYLERSKGYRIYCLSHSTRIIKTRHAEFLENANNSGSGSFKRIELQEARDETPIIHVPIPINASLDTSNDHLIAQDHPNNVEETESNPEINVEPQETQ